jgi:pentatricopeptide repeat protein
MSAAGHQFRMGAGMFRMPRKYFRHVLIPCCVWKRFSSTTAAMRENAARQQQPNRIVFPYPSQFEGDMGKLRHERAQLHKYNTRIASSEGSFLAESIFKEMLSQQISPSIVTYNTLLSKYSQDGRMEDMDALVGKMKDCGLRLDVYSYTTMIEGLTRAGNMARAEALYEDFNKEGLEADLVLYNALLTMFCKQGKVDQAESVFQDIKEHGLVPDSASFSILIAGHGRQGNPSRSFALLKDMLAKKIMPDHAVFNAIVLALGLNGRSALHDFSASYQGKRIFPGNLHHIKD